MSVEKIKCPGCAHNMMLNPGMPVAQFGNPEDPVRDVVICGRCRLIVDITDRNAPKCAAISPEEVLVLMANVFEEARRRALNN